MDRHRTSDKPLTDLVMTYFRLYPQEQTSVKLVNFVQDYAFEIVNYIHIPRSREPFPWQELTLPVLKPEYYEIARPRPWLLMPWLFAYPIVLDMPYKRSIVFHEVKYQLLSSRFPELIKNANIFPGLLPCKVNNSLGKLLSWRWGFSASRLLVQPFVQGQIKENTKSQRHWPLSG